MSLSIHDLTTTYPGTDFQLGPMDGELQTNQTIGLLGPNGSGKSTFLRVLIGDVDADDGRAVWKHDLDLLSCSASERAREVAWLPQYPRIAFEYTVEEVLKMGTYVRSDSDPSRALEQALDLAKLQDLRDRSVFTLSGGERQRMFLGRVLAQRPRLILLDEPASGLDRKFSWALPEILDQAREQFGELTVLWAQHDLEQSTRVSDSVWLFSEGDIVEKGMPEDVMTSETLSEIYNVPIHAHKDSENNLRFDPASHGSV